jgi:ADP-ribose pyrophosphatase YjhB (NUDIX family)
VGAGHDASKGETFYGPPGGGIEFGERAVDAVRRELREELAADVRDVTLVGVLENIFTYEDQPGHEIVFVFEARLVDASLYEREEIAGVEGDQPFVVRWIPLPDAVLSRWLSLSRREWLAVLATLLPSADSIWLLAP